MAEPPILTLADLRLTFGGDALFAGVGLAVHPGERIALVGRNGSGKSTLMRLMAGLVEADAGVRFVRPGTSVGYMAQEPGVRRVRDARGLRRAGARVGEEWRVAAAMDGLRLEPGLTPERASGGERRRAALAKLIAEAPEVLLLDEPTNHLDIAAIAWLEAHLAASRTAFVVVSHDRAFLRNLTDRVLWVDRGEVRRLDRGFAAFEEWRDKVFEEEDQARHKMDRLLKAEGRWAVEGISARRKRNMGRVRRLQEMRAERRAQILRAGTARLAFEGGAASGKLVVEAEHVSQRFGGREIVRDFSIRVARGERVAFVGPNGVGKTTLLRILTGELRADEGRVRLGANLVTAVFDQNRAGAARGRDAVGGADRGRAGAQRPGDGAGQAPARRRLPEGVPVRRGAGAGAGLGAVGGRAGAAAARQADGGGVEPAGARRADQRPRRRDPRPARGAGRGLRRDGARRQPRPRLHRPGGDDDGGDGGRRAGGDLCRRLDRLPGAARGGRGRGAGAGPRAKAAPGRAARGGGEGGAASFTQAHRLETLPAEIDRLAAEIGRLEVLLGDPELFTREPGKFAKASAALVARQEALAAAEDEWLTLEALREEAAGR